MYFCEDTYTLLTSKTFTRIFISYLYSICELMLAKYIQKRGNNTNRNFGCITFLLGKPDLATAFLLYKKQGYIRLSVLSCTMYQCHQTSWSSLVGYAGAWGLVYKSKIRFWSKKKSLETQLKNNLDQYYKRHLTWLEVRTLKRKLSIHTFFWPNAGIRNQHIV